MTTTTQTVREIALDQPSSIRVFEQFGIDYCCGGRKPLAEACAAGQLEVDQVIAALEAAEKGPLPNTIDWTTLPLAALAQHITATHHAYVKRELPRLALLSAKVINRHWLAANMATEAYLGFNAFNTKKITGKDTIDFIEYRRRIAGSAAFDAEFMAAVLAKPKL